MFETKYHLDEKNKKLVVVRKFSASLEAVWQAWTDNKKLDQWFAPKPWIAQTKSFDFRVGGIWLYCMIGPNKEKVWSLLKFLDISPMKYYSAQDAFCDENGLVTKSMPSMNWHVAFTPVNNDTLVTSTIIAENFEDISKIIEMGFQQGFAMAHTNLDALLTK